jgi:hypothetical protein
MTEKNLNTPAITPFAEQETVPSTRREAGAITTSILEEHPTPAVMGAEAPPSVSVELSASGPFGVY